MSAGAGTSPTENGPSFPQEGQTARFEFTVTDGDMAAFAALSGDQNPLHSDAAFAVARGFEGRVVYGAILLAKVSRMIGMELPGRDSLWTTIDMQFVSPLYVGQTAILEAEVAQISDATRTVGLRLIVRRGSELIARGKAHVKISDAE